MRWATLTGNRRIRPTIVTKRSMNWDNWSKINSETIFCDLYRWQSCELPTELVQEIWNSENNIGGVIDINSLHYKHREEGKGVYNRIKIFIFRSTSCSDLSTRFRFVWTQIYSAKWFSADRMRETFYHPYEYHVRRFWVLQWIVGKISPLKKL